MWKDICVAVSQVAEERQGREVMDVTEFESTITQAESS